MNPILKKSLIIPIQQPFLYFSYLPIALARLIAFANLRWFFALTPNIYI
jgi:hypothetical protein